MSKTKEQYRQFEDVSILMQYLYADENRFVDVKTIFDTTMRIRMNDLSPEMMILESSDDKFTHREFSISEWCDMIDQLKEQHRPGSGNSVWEEIRIGALAERTLNSLTSRKDFMV